MNIKINVAMLSEFWFGVLFPYKRRRKAGDSKRAKIFNSRISKQRRQLPSFSFYVGNNTAINLVL